jgi:predicted cobalt transporter CbtA
MTGTASSRTLFAAALVAGLIAGGVAAAFHLVVTERLIDRAIQHEEQARRAHGGPSSTPVVSRATQKVGLVVGLMAYGAVWGLLFALGHESFVRRFPALTSTGRGWLLAAFGGWSVSVFPFLKYPANPPGVGAAQTIGYRQALYLGFVALSIAGVAAATSLARTGRTQRPTRAWLLAAAFYVMYAVALYIAMPPNPDPVEAPSGLVWGFRVASLSGLLLFWVVLGAAFGRLAQVRAHG